MARVSIIILTYNSSRFIDSLLKSLKVFGKEAEIIVVDNDSTDDTIEKIKNSKELKIIETGKNLGFAAGINYGAKKANGEFLLFINPDAKFEKGKLEDMISIFENNEKVGIVGGKMIGNSGNVEMSAGKFFSFAPSILIALGLDEAFGVRFSPNKTSKVDFVSGGFMMVKSKIFKDLSGFDEKFFMYIEDMELCFRTKKAGFDTYFNPNVEIMHLGQGSSNRSFAIKNIYKGILYFHKKHYPGSYLIIKFVFWLKAITLVLVGKIINNKYLTETYTAALSSL